MLNDILITDLNKLIRNCKQSQEHYRIAAEEIGSDELSNVFIDYSAQRRDFATTLTNLLADKGEFQSNEISSHSNIDHPDKITLNLADQNAEVILAQFEQGETELLHIYEHMIDINNDTEILNILREQYQKIIKARDYIQKLLAYYS